MKCVCFNFCNKTNVRVENNRLNTSLSTIPEKSKTPPSVAKMTDGDLSSFSDSVTDSVTDIVASSVQSSVPERSLANTYINNVDLNILIVKPKEGTTIISFLRGINASPPTSTPEGSPVRAKVFSDVAMVRIHI